MLIEMVLVCWIVYGIASSLLGYWQTLKLEQLCDRNRIAHAKHFVLIENRQTRERRLCPVNMEWDDEIYWWTIPGNQKVLREVFLESGGVDSNVQVPFVAIKAIFIDGTESIKRRFSDG